VADLILVRPMTLLANMAVPTLVPHVFWGVCALIPVILIETPFLLRRFELPFRRALWLSALANVRSTLLGIPLAWLLFVILCIPVAIAMDHVAAGQNTFDWILPECLMLGARSGISPQTEFLASMILIVPYYIASVFLERATLRDWLPVAAPASLMRTSIQMNLASYAFLLGAFFLAYAHTQGKV
jgi:hypothetical protein